MQKAWNMIVERYWPVAVVVVLAGLFLQEMGL